MFSDQYYQSNRVLVVCREYESHKERNITKINIREKGGIRNVK